MNTPDDPALYNRVQAASLAAVRGRRRRRIAARASAAVVLVGSVLIATLPRDASPEVPDIPAVTAHAEGIQRIRTERGMASRLAAATGPTTIRRIVAHSRVRRLDDQALSQWLRAAGHAPARIRIGESVFVPGLNEPIQTEE